MTDQPDRIVWDNHACMPLRADDSFLAEIERFRRAGVDIVSLNIGYGEMGFDRHLATLSFMRRWFSEHEEQYTLVSTVDDIHRAKCAGKLGIVFDVEGMTPVQDNVELVDRFYALGVRWMLIAYNKNNRAGGGCLDADTGLTRIGRAIIDAMERVGMVLCLSHSGGRTVRDALEYATNPPIFSHSNPAGVTAHARNVSDELLKACAAKGGVVGISGIGPFLGVNNGLIDQLVRHIRYSVDLVGPQHVGLGLDFVFDTAELDADVRAHPERYPSGVNGGLAMVSPEAFPDIASRLSHVGLSDDDVSAILGGNWLRIARCVWR